MMVARLVSRARDVWFDAWDACRPGPFSEIYRRVRPYTLCGHVRLRALYHAIHETAARGIAGDLVECGTARGGSAALMGLALKGVGADRTLWVFDTFEGLPPPSDADPDREIAERYTGAYRSPRADVSALFERLGISANARLIQGRFQETLPACRIGRIAVLHLDCDWYESVRCCLDSLYDRVSPGGVIQIDDYGHWQGARKAVDEFLAARSLALKLRWLDYTGRQLIKPA